MPSACLRGISKPDLSKLLSNNRSTTNHFSDFVAYCNGFHCSTESRFSKEASHCVTRFMTSRNVQLRVAITCITFLPPFSTLPASNPASSRFLKFLSSHSNTAHCSRESFASILSNMSLTKPYAGSKIIRSRTLLLNLNFQLNHRVVKKSAKVRCTNWGLPSTSFIPIPVLSLPACTFPKNSCISSVFLLCNDSSTVVGGGVATKAHFSKSLKYFSFLSS